MKTLKLYERDAYISRFEATVLSCEREKDICKSVLSETAFFPEGGGQPCDKGSLAGQEVIDVQIINGEIYHFTRSPLPVGLSVSGKIDFARRFGFMQNHTAEHIVSGIVHKRFGFDNIGFHLGESEVTFDFNGFFTASQLEETELEANRRVWQNLSVTAFYPAKEQLSEIQYRSKSGIEGDIRLVEIENTDICACCAPHVKSTGEIGIIKFLGTEKQHGGTRIFMKCGGFALSDYGRKINDIKEVCELLSAKQDGVREAVLQLYEKLQYEKQAHKESKEKLLDLMIKCFDSSKPAVAVGNAGIKDLQIAADGLHKAYGGVRTAIAENGSDTAFVMCGDMPEIETQFDKLKSSFDIKGGGRDGIRQGSIKAPFAEVKEFFGI